jgi:hypothetical protein
MGYDTEFSGKFTFDKPLNPAQINYLKAFNATRRMQRNAEITATYPDPVRLAVGLPIGEEGGYFVGDTENFGQNNTPDVTDYNNPPEGQPGLWCKWEPTDDGSAIVWDGGEKFYLYIKWIEYMIEHFLIPWGLVLNGVVEWDGESNGDLGVIEISNNVVKVII